ncbi:MAG: hypothetical protein ACOXZT_04045 [Tissierellaceae bacterium]|nr:hypothetical protein [Tissierellia bacterium]
METRMERYKRIRKERFIRRSKAFVILILIIGMTYGLIEVNKSIKDLNLINNDNLIGIDMKNRTVDFLGKSYQVDFNIIKDLIKP